MKVKECCKDREQKTRREILSALLKEAWYESESEREFVVEAYSKSLLSIEDIINITAPLREMSKNAAKSKSKIFGSNSQAKVIAAVPGALA